jgi:hypothetical protein
LPASWAAMDFSKSCVVWLFLFVFKGVRPG